MGGISGVVCFRARAQLGDAVVERGEFDERRRGDWLGRADLVERVACGGEGSGQPGQARVLGAAVVGELVHLLRILRDGVGKVAEADRRCVGVGDPQHQAPDGLRHRRAVFQAGVVEAGEVVIAVVDRVIDAARLALAPERDVERRQAKMLEERRIIRPRPEGADRQVAAAFRRRRCRLVAAPVAVVCIGEQLRAGAGGDRPAALGVGHVGGNGVGEVLIFMAAARAVEAAFVAVGIDVNDCLRLELGGVGFDIFGRAEEHRLLPVPAEVDDRPVGPPARFDELPERLRLRQHRDIARQRIGRAEHPAVVVIAAHDPFVGVLRALQRRDDVVQRLERPVRLDREVDLDAVVAADVVGDGQPALKAVGRGRTGERGEQLRRVAIGHRQRRDFEDRGRRCTRQPPGHAGDRAHSGRRRIAGVGRHVGDRAALDAERRARAALGVNVAVAVAVLLRIGIDDAADRAMLLRQLGLEAAPPGTVAGDGDLALHVDPAPGERLIVGGKAVVDVNQRCGDVAVALEGDIRRERVLRVAAGRILWDRRFLPAQHDALRRHHLDRRADRRRV